MGDTAQRGVDRKRGGLEARAVDRQGFIEMFGPRIAGDSLLLDDDKSRGIGRYLQYLDDHPEHEVAVLWNRS